MKRYSGREFSPADLQAITRTIELNPTLKRTPLSRLVCEQLNWRRPDGRLREMSCRVAMLRMQADGLITLPASQIPKPRRRAQFIATPATDEQPVLAAAVHELPALSLHIVDGRGAASRLWNEYVARYHYLGYTPMSGSQIRYSVYAGDRLVALLSFGASAWKLADRERFIGWTHEQRQKNLQLVVNNARFLILPWIQSKGLASKILAMAARRLPVDWLARYGYQPVMLEMRQRLKLAKSTLSPESALDKLRRIQRHSVSINAGAPIGGVSTINQEQASVLAALNLKKPTPDPQMSLL